jgi:hypothetical protein
MPFFHGEILYLVRFRQDAALSIAALKTWAKEELQRRAGARFARFAAPEFSSMLKLGIHHENMMKLGDFIMLPSGYVKIVDFPIKKW